MSTDPTLPFYINDRIIPEFLSHNMHTKHINCSVLPIQETTGEMFEMHIKTLLL
mgnify:CR=1 FL=1